MDCPIDGSILVLSKLSLLQIAVLSIVPKVITVDVWLGELVSRFHLPVELVNFELQDFYVHGTVLGLAAYGRETVHFQNVVVLLGLWLPFAVVTVPPWELSLQDHFVETGPTYLLLSCFWFFFLFFLKIFASFLLDLLYSLQGFHVPEEGLLVVVSAEIDEVADQVDDEIVLGEDGGTFVGLIKFCSLSLKLNISSNL